MTFQSVKETYWGGDPHNRKRNETYLATKKDLPLYIRLI